MSELAEMLIGLSIGLAAVIIGCVLGYFSKRNDDRKHREWQRKHGIM